MLITTIFAVITQSCTLKKMRELLRRYIVAHGIEDIRVHIIFSRPSAQLKSNIFRYTRPADMPWHKQTQNKNWTTYVQQILGVLREDQVP